MDHHEVFRITENQRQKATGIPWQSVRGVLFDWAGTTVDYGCLAPVEVVREVFRESGIEVTEAEARLPMGKAKIDHLREVLSMPRVAQLWSETRGTPNDNIVQQLYQRFLVVQKAVLAKYSELIPGVIEFVRFLGDKGIAIGSTTGYTRELMDVLIPIARDAGYNPQATVCSDEVAAGRPAPWSNFRAAELIGVYPMNQIIIVDDSIAGIQAGKHSGCYSVAVTVTGNAIGKSRSEVAAMEPTELMRQHHRAEAEFYAAGADLVVPSVATLHEIWSSSR